MTTGWCIVRRRRPAGAGGPARRVHDDPGRLDHALADERLEGDRGRGHVAAGSRDEPAPASSGSEQLGKAVDEPAEQLRGAVLEPVPERVERRVAEPEVGAEVDDEAGVVDESRHDVLRLARREGDEDDVETVEAGRVERGEGEVAVGGRQVRVERRDRRSGRAVALGHRDLENRVARQEPQQLRPEIAGRPGDARPS